MPFLPSAPSLPSRPFFPSTPSLPSRPFFPSVPFLPSRPFFPSTPSLPLIPSLPSMPFLPSAPSLPSRPFFPSAPSLPFSPAAPRSSVSATRSRHSSSAGYLHWIAVPLLRTSGSAALVFTVLPHPAVNTMQSTVQSAMIMLQLRFFISRYLRLLCG